MPDTSIKDLIAGSANSNVFVRSNSPAKLEKLLEDKKIIFKQADGGLRITDQKTDEIGKLAFAAGIPILELSNHSASLEEVFLELTAGTEEYKAHPEGKK